MTRARVTALVDARWGLLAAFVAATVLAIPTVPVRAEDSEAFAPPVGTVLDYHVKTTNRTGNATPFAVEGNNRQIVLENDGLVSKVTYAASNLVRDGKPFESANDDSADNYLVRRSYDVIATASSMRGADAKPKLVVQTFDCVKGAIQSFLPLGRVPSVRVYCKISTALDGGQPEEAGDISQDVVFEGRSRLVTPAGKFFVSHVRITYDRGNLHVDNLLLFDTSKGLLVEADTVSTSPSGSSSSVLVLQHISP